MRRLLLLFVLLSSPAYAVGTLGYVNVKDYGALGNGTSDDWAAIQNVIDNVAAERATIYFPAGHYVVSQTINCGTRGYNFRGDGRPQPFNVWLGGSYIRGTIAGPILQSFYPAGMLSIQDMGFGNRHGQGVGLLLSGSNVALLRVSVIANRAIEMAPSAFTTSMQQIVVRAQAGFPVGSVGIAARGHTLIHGADIVGFDVGLRLCGIGNDVRSARIEVNRIGVELGVNPDGTNNPILASSVESLSLEANDYGVVVRTAVMLTLRSVLVQGSINSPSAGSRVGVQVANAQWSAFEQIISNGSFSEASIRILPTTVPLRWSGCKAGNTNTSALTLDYTPSPLLLLEQCS